ncbi:MAG: hypothetical protein KDA28_00430, partial [Phycisphaerales bacterium]|nr:hypothetical protein [Phycisphaerales bacterium]
MAGLLTLASMVIVAEDEPPPQRAKEARSAAVILREADRVRPPSFSSGNDPESLRRFDEAHRKAAEKIGNLALEMVAGHPRHPRTPELLRRRWGYLNNFLGRPRDVIREVELLLANDPPCAVRRAATVATARSAVATPDLGYSERMRLWKRAVDEVSVPPAQSEGGRASKSYQEDLEGAWYNYLEGVLQWSNDNTVHAKVASLALEEAGDTQWLAPEAKATLRLTRRIREPL